MTPSDGESYEVPRTPAAAADPEVARMANSLRTLCVVELLLAILALFFFNFTLVMVVIPTDVIGIMACRYLRKPALVMFSILKLFSVGIIVWNSSYIISAYTCSDCPTASHLPVLIVLLFVGLFYQFCCLSLARRLHVKLNLLELQDPATAHVELGNLHAEQPQARQEFLPAEHYLPVEHFQPGQLQPYPPYGYYPQFAAAPGYAYPPGAVPQFVPPGYHSVMMPYPTYPAPAPPAGEGQEPTEVVPSHIPVEGEQENKQ